MRAARLHGIKDLRLEELPVPRPGPGELLVRVEACGICPTDARKYAIGVSGGEYPLNPGHEWVGLIEETGPETGGWSRGDRVYGDTYGGYAELALVPARPQGWSCGAIRMDPALPLERAVFLEPLADCLHAVHDQARVTAGDPVIVFSAGSMGLQIIAVASLAGARVLVVEPIAERREIARAFGAQQAVSPEEWRGAAEAFAAGGFAAAIVVIGKAGLVSQAIEVAAPGGRVVAFAGFGNEPAAVIDLNRIHYGEVQLVGSHWIGTPPNQHLNRYAQARDLLASPDLALERIVTRMIEFDQVEDALVRHADHRGLKTVLIPGRPQ
jgi:2-desacetyl-2-hydroxyethyl bacteriochlorophyllide A dehydrogenase